MFPILRKLAHVVRPTYTLSQVISPNLANFNAVFAQPNLQSTRWKSKGGKKSSKAVSSESGTEEDPTDRWEDQLSDKHTKTLNITVPSMRIDVLLKTGLGLARNKVETFFYESKIRVNGKKMQKKSALAAIGDELDIIKGTNPDNPSFLTVARVEVVDVFEKGEGLSVKIRRSKSLTIEQYENAQ